MRGKPIRRPAADLVITLRVDPARGEAALDEGAQITLRPQDAVAGPSWLAGGKMAAMVSPLITTLARRVLL